MGEYTHAAPIDQEHLSWGVSYAAHPSVRFTRAPAVRSGHRRRACGKKEEAAAARRNAGTDCARRRRSTSSRGPATSSAARPTRPTTGSPKFETDTGCKVNVKTAGTSDEMVSLMTPGRLRPRHRLRRCLAAPDSRRHRAADRRREGAELRHRRSAPEGSAVALRGRQALRRAVPVGPERAHVQHRRCSRPRRPRGRWCSSRRSCRTASRTRAACRPSTVRSTSRTPRCT